MGVHNGSAGWLILWLEPLGEDRWLRPGETFQVRSDHQGEQYPLTLYRGVDPDGPTAGLEYVEVWVDHGPWVTVTDSSGVVVECGHQRPADVSRQWTRPTSNQLWRWLWG